MVAVGYRRLGERMGDAGSSYTWIRAAFGPKRARTVLGLLLVAKPVRRAGDRAAGRDVHARFRRAVARREHRRRRRGRFALDDRERGRACGSGCGRRPSSPSSCSRPRSSCRRSRAARDASRGRMPSRSRARRRSGRDPGCRRRRIWMIDGWEVSARRPRRARGRPLGPGIGGLAGLALTSVLLIAAVLAFSRIGSAAGYDAHQSDAAGVCRRACSAAVAARVGDHGPRSRWPRRCRPPSSI